MIEIEDESDAVTELSGGYKDSTLSHDRATCHDMGTSAVASTEGPK